MNACTEYFMFLEQTCPALEENTILMPADLQSDVIVPIVNFMYTGMLEFHITLFERLYKAAEMMNITVLTKLLEAQKPHIQPLKKIKTEIKAREQKKAALKPLFSSPELPPTLPGRKVPVWKRKTAPPHSPPQTASQTSFRNEPTYDPLSLPDNTPKPTRFEWPEEDLPPINLMDTSFEDISLTSKPLLTKEEEEKSNPCFDDLRNNVEIPPKRNSGRASSSNSINTKEVEDFVKEQKIRSNMFEDADDVEFAQKRKMDQIQSKLPLKKMKISNKENKETTISVEGTDVGNIDHTKIVTEILKKYPDLVKKNKNIKLKIMSSGGTKSTPEKRIIHAVSEAPKKTETVIPERYNHLRSFSRRKPTITEETNEDGPWVCSKCIDIGGELQEFVLYYLYRKHMTDVHNEIFDASLCKYCGRKCSNHNLMMYHLYTKHALKPPSSYNFPKCDRCPYIALSSARLNKHKHSHNPNEIQCQDCKLAFTNSQTLTCHIRVTGHYNKPGRVSYDCQYCMKKLQSAINLFTHIKNSHLKEGKRDGIVCLDELDSIDDMANDKEEEQESENEYVTPEMQGSGMQKDKVKIISNVKVPPNQQSSDGAQQSQTISLEASSEAESLNNVASGIATSLGLVDIVVLDDNQQYILQDGQHEQTEFIIPELSSGQQFARQVITTQHNTVIPQGMIQTSGSDIGSTDELVMVLTDHDYPDEHDGENQENSNIVVLYSHPVEGQEGQYITSQGNLLVNSQTGMLEIRNGTTIASSSNQMIMTNAVETPVESIEMIQREIEGHKDLKQEPYYEEDRKLEISSHQQPPEHVESQQTVVEESVEETVDHGKPHQESVADQSEIVEHQEDSQDAEKDGEDDVDNSRDCSMEEPMEIEDIPKDTTIKENESQIQVVQETADIETTVVSEADVQTPQSTENEQEGIDIPPENSNTSTGESENVIINDPTSLSMEEQPHIEIEGPKDDIQEVEEPMEVDGQIGGEGITEERQQAVENEECGEENRTEDGMEKLDEGHSENDKGHSENDKEQTAASNGEEKGETEEAAEEDTVEEEAEEEETVEDEDEQGSSEVQPEPSEATSTNNDEDANSPRQNQTHEQPDKSQVDINKTILDDWEDESDSQQSEKQANAKETKQSEEIEQGEESETSKTAAAADNDIVNKLRLVRIRIQIKTRRIGKSG
ncbi:hypothetical protein JTB14_008137 [Gonioctena quinquepunctata]|nr:hypothetical protein JTB14_008137 [Gonioctena quinquepunctata]